MPGIWPKFTARTELGMAIYQSLEEGGPGVPKAFAPRLDVLDLSLVDCYSLAEALLDDATIDKLGRVEKRRRNS